MARDKLSKAACNPMSLEVGDSVGVVGFEGLRFTVLEVAEHKPITNEQTIRFTDYVASAKSLSNKAINIRIRFMPSDNHEATQIILLSTLDTFGYAKAFEDIVSDESGELHIDADAKYRRVNVVETLHVRRCGIGRKGTVREDDVAIWDFRRIGEKREWLFVELSKLNRGFTILRGQEIAPEDIRTSAM
jgi:hypothetical protein